MAPNRLFTWTWIRKILYLVERGPYKYPKFNSRKKIFRAKFRQNRKKKYFQNSNFSYFLEIKAVINRCKQKWVTRKIYGPSWKYTVLKCWNWRSFGVKYTPPKNHSWVIDSSISSPLADNICSLGIIYESSLAHQ